jgi:hypothetical protein
MLNKTTVFVVTLFYLVIVFFVLGAIGNDIDVNYTSTAQSMGGTVKFLGMSVNIGGGFLGNIVLGIQSLPIAINTIFIIIPAIMCVVFGIAQFIPTEPS